MTQVWFRNPELYVKELVELRVGDLVWDIGYLKKKSIDPATWADLYYPADMNYRMLVVGGSSQGTLELQRGDTMDRPTAIYDTWQYGEDLSLLESAMESPSCADSNPMVVVTDLPPMQSGLGRALIRQFRDLQEEYPDVRLHLHGLYAWKLMFSLPFRSVDIDPRTDAKKGKITLPTGKAVIYEHAAHHQQWVNLLGFSTTQLNVPRNRCMYNIRSAQWAGKHYRTDIKVKTSGSVSVDPDSPNHAPATTSAVRDNRRPAMVGDKFHCDTCSLQDSCKYYRSGAVCSVPDSEPAPLSRFFKTRNADTIIEGLGTVMAAQAARLNRGMENEGIFGEIDPEVTKIVNSLMTHGVKLAKLVDPKLAAAGAARVNVGITQVNGAQPAQALMASIVAELEGRGFTREQITPELVMQMLENPDDFRRKAIDAAVIDRSA